MKLEDIKPGMKVKIVSNPYKPNQDFYGLFNKFIGMVGNVELNDLTTTFPIKVNLEEWVNWFYWFNPENLEPVNNEFMLSDRIENLKPD